MKKTIRILCQSFGWVAVCIYFGIAYFLLFTCYAQAYIDPSAVTYLIQAVAAVAIAAGAALTVLRHKILEIFRKGSAHRQRREIHLKEPLDEVEEESSCN